jgi:very-short-patch-repair endonuclease
MLVIDLDGGGHGHEEQAAYDALRASEPAKPGIRVLRFWNNDVTGNLDGVLKAILDALGESPPSP